MQTKNTETPKHWGIVFILAIIGFITFGPQVIPDQKIIGGIALLWPLALIMNKKRAETGKKRFNIDEHLPK